MAGTTAQHSCHRPGFTLLDLLRVLHLVQLRRGVPATADERWGIASYDVLPYLLRVCRPLVVASRTIPLRSHLTPPLQRSVVALVQFLLAGTSFVEMLIFHAWHPRFVFTTRGVHPQVVTVAVGDSPVGQRLFAWAALAGLLFSSGLELSFCALEPAWRRHGRSGFLSCTVLR